ncbi:creatininase family protein [bacterium SCSIO 12696]|nr:creatininase family protein [bacterium SCSIO 12696]
MAADLSTEEIWALERPIPAHDTVVMEDMTWMEVRDAIKSGKTTVIIPTGGVEQKGPYSVIGRHNLSLKVTTQKIAKKLGNALVAPVVPFVPQGSIDPPSRHMRYPGTISVSEENFVNLLVDIANSLRMHRFENIILLGDNGGNRKGLERAEKILTEQWQNKSARVHYIREFYDNPRWKAWLKSRGIIEVSEGLHDGFRASSVMLLIDPMAARMPQRIAADKFSINGVSLLPVDRTIKIAKEFVDYRTDITVAAIRRETSSTDETQ